MSDLSQRLRDLARNEDSLFDDAAAMLEAAKRIDQLEAERDGYRTGMAVQAERAEGAERRAAEAVRIVRQHRDEWEGAPLAAPEKVCQILLNAFAAAGIAPDREPEP